MEKKLIVEFNVGEIYEIDAVELAKLIVDKDPLCKDSPNMEPSEFLNLLLEDEFELLSYVWDIPWVEIQPHAVKISNKYYDISKEWINGDAKIQINW